jgi:hypothetical protein
VLRRGISHGLFAPPPRPYAPARASPRWRRSQRPAAVRRRDSLPDVARQSAAWTCRTGSVQVKPQGFRWRRLRDGWEGGFSCSSAGALSNVARTTNWSSSQGSIGASTICNSAIRRISCAIWAWRGCGGHAPAPPGQSDGTPAAEPHGQMRRLKLATSQNVLLTQFRITGTRVTFDVIVNQFNQRAPLVSHDRVFGSGNELVSVPFTVMILFAMAGMTIFLVPVRSTRWACASDDLSFCWPPCFRLSLSPAVARNRVASITCHYPRTDGLSKCRLAFIPGATVCHR